MICTTEYYPIIAEAAFDVPEYSNSRFLAIDDNKSVRPIGNHGNIDGDTYTISPLIHHKFWVIANKQYFRSAKSESDLANPNNIVGVGCFVSEKQNSKFFVFNIDGVLFHGPVIFPDGGSYVSLCKSDVIHDGIMLDYDILKNYLNDINNVEYWDFKKHA